MVKISTGSAWQDPLSGLSKVAEKTVALPSLSSLHASTKKALNKNVGIPSKSLKYG